ncbi:unnamed protein product [marine sediment metagenome]|uniref:Uncharacterized protein n=1 Tax=marine sediment metagenome TaxID=412755 RepID=X1BRJ3_9ZZZZ
MAVGSSLSLISTVKAQVPVLPVGSATVMVTVYGDNATLKVEPDDMLGTADTTLQLSPNPGTV